MVLNIPQSPINDANGNMSPEWLIFLNQLVATVNQLEQASKVVTP